MCIKYVIITNMNKQTNVSTKFSSKVKIAFYYDLGSTRIFFFSKETEKTDRKF